MALRASRPHSLHQDENAQANIISGKVPLHERKGLQQQQQQQHGLVERKKLSNITNHVLSQPKLASKATAEKESFAIRADTQESVPMPKKTSRPPLKNISNGTPNPLQNSSSKPPLKPKAQLKPETQNSAPPFQLPPRSKLNLTEEMKKKAALWAEEGIERVHLTGDDMEKQRLMRDEEIATRVAMIRNSRIDIPFPPFRGPCIPDLSSPWKPSGDVLELDVVKDLSDDETGCENEVVNSKLVEELLERIDYFAIPSPPRFTEGWPKIKENEEIQ